MLRINLLPPYIYEGKKRNKLAAVWGIIGAATVIGFLVWQAGVNKTLETAKADEATAKAFQGQYQDLEGKIGGVKKEIADTQQKQDFVATAQVYNDSWRDGLYMVRDVVNPRIVLNAVSFDQTRSAVTMDAFAPSEVDAIKWWMVLLNQEDKFTNVNITLPPHGYEPGGGGATVGGAAPRGMMGGSMGGFAGGKQSLSLSASGSGGGSMGAMGRPPGMMGGGSMGMMGGRGPMGGAGASAAGSLGELEGRTGFNFVCIAGLKNPLKGGPTAPAWSGVGGGAAGAAAPGGMMGGGSMGMMGGSMGMSAPMPPAGAGAPAARRGGGSVD